MAEACNAGHAFGLVLVDELVRAGVSDAVVAPGSRSTPVALALASRDDVRVHVRIDERSAAFLALGLAKASGRPVPVLCTSGTAASHFHAAALEADQARVPLVLLTADRPPELRGVGANQTIDQVGLYGSAVRWARDAAVPEAAPGVVESWRSMVRGALGAAVGLDGAAPGPVHLNLPLREPLVPVDDGTGFPYPLALGLPPDPPASVRPDPAHDAAADEVGKLVRTARRGVVVAGDGLSPSDGEATAAFAERNGWPLIAEPHSNARRGSTALWHADALLRNPAFAESHPPDLALVVGRPTVSRIVGEWLASVPYAVLDPYGSWWDVPRRSVELLRAGPRALASVEASAEAGWGQAWQGAADRVATAVDAVLDAEDMLSEPRVARDLTAALPTGSALLVASSMPIRDVDAMMRPRTGVRVLANRGVAGIDGFVSTALGVALVHDGGPTWALAGDLSLLHDSNGLAAGPTRPDLSLLVLNNDGGGIFSLLPQATYADADTFERLFGTPPGVDIAALAAAYGVPHRLLRTADDLHSAIERPVSGMRILEVRTERTANATLHGKLRAVADAALERS